MNHIRNFVLLFISSYFNSNIIKRFFGSGYNTTVFRRVYCKIDIVAKIRKGCNCYNLNQYYDNQEMRRFKHKMVVVVFINTHDAEFKVSNQISND